MLGEVVFEFKGRFVSYRILKDDRWETTEEYKGSFLGEESTFTLTGESDFKPDGTGYCEFWGVFYTEGGSSGRYNGIGNITQNPDGPNIWRGVFCFSNPPGKYARLNGIAVVFEGEWIDNDIRLKGWEWG
jgi:hypothetical protein